MILEGTYVRGMRKRKQEEEGMEKAGGEMGGVVGGRFRLGRLIGDGGYGSVYVATDERAAGWEVALKTEKRREREVGRQKQLLRQEALVLRKLSEATPSLVPKFIAVGHLPGPEPLAFLAMELVGCDLSRLRKATVHGRLALPFVLQITDDILTALHTLHLAGFIHRDVKPANFALRPGPRSSQATPQIVMLDFGLSRAFALPDGRHRSRRPHLHFRGTRSFASLRALWKQDQSRRDDLVSLFYSLVELARGPLPWRSLTTPVEVRTAKFLLPAASLLFGLPPPIADFHDHISSLTFAQNPDYQLLHNLLQQALALFQAP